MTMNTLDTDTGLQGGTLQSFLLPDLGEGLTEAEIVSWLVAVGDEVELDQPVVEVESAKSVVELPSPYAGRVSQLHAEPGTTITAGSPLITIATSGPDQTSPTSPAGVPGEADPPEATPAPASELVPGTALRPALALSRDAAGTGASSVPAEEGSGAVLIGYGTRESNVRLRRPAGGRFGKSRHAGAGEHHAGDASAASPTATPAIVASATTRAAASAASPAATPATAASDTTRADTIPATASAAVASADGPASALPRRSPVVSPLVRKYARTHGIDASLLIGSGPGALVTRADVEAAIRARDSTPGIGLAPGTSRPATSPGASWPAAGSAESRPAAAPDASANGTAAAPEDTIIPLTGMRKRIAEHLSLSRTVIPEATVWLDVDASELVAARDTLQRITGERFSFTTLIARFVVEGLKLYPILNSSVDDEGDRIIQHGAINLGLAAQTPRGLVVPVVHGAHALSLRSLRDAIQDLVARAEKGDYPPPLLAGGTFTFNNYGGFGVDGSSPIINHPEAAMLGLGRIIDRPWVVDGQIVPRKVTTLSLVFDHRVCDGDAASGFLAYVAACVEQPLRLLADL